MFLKSVKRNVRLPSQYSINIGTLLVLALAAIHPISNLYQNKEIFNKVRSSSAYTWLIDWLIDADILCSIKDYQQKSYNFRREVFKGILKTFV
jgi:hypothetical protein